MSIPLISVGSLFPSMTPGATQVRGDHSLIAQAGQMGELAVKRGKTDTVTISKKAIQMVSTTHQSGSQGTISEKAVDQTRNKK